MTSRLRDRAPLLLAGAAGVWAMTYLALYGFGWNDYLDEALPAYNALTAGHVWQFLTLAPGYGGSLELRAPFALLAALSGGHQVAVYQAVGIPCLIVAALFAVWLVERMRELGRTRLAQATAFGLCVANPVSFFALQMGHAEELLGAVLCVAAVIAAQRGASTWCAVLLGLAIVNKQWALLAVGPVLVALPRRRLRTLAIAGGLATCFYVPLFLPSWLAHASAGGTGGGGAAAAAAASGGAGSIFQPWQLWWFLGSHGHLIKDAFGVVKVGYRAPPGWVQTISHPLVIAMAVPATLLALALRRRDAMLLLALLLALRCALDSWDTVYYPLPFLFALLSWETFARHRPPLLALAASVAVWLVFSVAPEHLSADGQAALFAAVAVPTLIALALALYAPSAGPALARWSQRSARRRGAAAVSRRPAVPS